VSFITTHIPDSVKITAKAPQKLNQLSTVVEKGNRKPVNQEIAAGNGVLLIFLYPFYTCLERWARPVISALQTGETAYRSPLPDGWLNSIGHQFPIGRFP